MEEVLRTINVQPLKFNVMASVTKLNVCEVREYARKSMNPETGDEKRWYDVQVTTAESFAGFKYDGDTKVEADVNALTKSAKTWLYAFTATADDVVACYNLLNEERLNSASDAAVALEVRLMLKGATIAIESTKYEVGDDYEGEVVEQPFYTRSVTTVK